MDNSLRKKRKNTNDRITVEALKYYVPLFHVGDNAAERLLSDENIEPGERNLLETKARLKDLAVDKIASLAGPLITRELNKIIKNSRLNGREDLYDILYYAGINGMIKGLRHFDVDKLNNSSTNYLFQWIVTYAKKELTIMEAPFGIAPSRFQKHKKISAVRKKLSDEFNRPATNEEIYHYFISGKADMKTMNGRLEKTNDLYAVNQNITMDLIEEQHLFEQNLNHIELLDIQEDYSAEIRLSEEQDNYFGETLFGVFLESYNFTDDAKAVLMSDLKVNNIPKKYAQIILELDLSVYRSLSNRWKDMMKDVHGPFYEFLVNISDNNFDQFDVDSVIKSIEAVTKAVKSSRYEILFVDKRIVRL